MIAWIGLGSNLGDCAGQVAAGAEALSQLGKVAARSALYVTPPVGPPQPDYVNAAVALETELAADRLLAELKRLETELGRTAGPRWGPRYIDFDLLLVEDQVIQSPQLTLPHPELQRRAFVLVPLAEIAPQVRHPVLGQTIAELRDALSARELAAIRRLPDSAWHR